METSTAHAQDRRTFPNERELTDRRAFIRSSVNEIIVMSDHALLHSTIPMADASRVGDINAVEVALHGPQRSTVKSRDANNSLTRRARRTTIKLVFGQTQST